MKVFVWVRLKKHPDFDSEGDIITVSPTNEHIPMPKLDINNLVPILMDLTIPCGEKFNNQTKECGSCKYNEPELCDYRKLRRVKMTGGTLYDPPDIVNKRMHYIDYKSILSQDTMTALQVEDKTLTEMQTVWTNASKLTNEQPKSIIQDR